MNFILKIVLVINFVAFTCQGIAAQQKYKITKAQIEPKVVSGKSVNYVNVKTLKTGSNYLKLSSGKVFHVQVAGGKVTGFKLTNRWGKQLSSFTRTDAGEQFECILISAHAVGIRIATICLRKVHVAAEQFAWTMFVYAKAFENLFSFS